MNPRRATCALLAAVLVALASQIGIASAAFPGANGAVAFLDYGEEKGEHVFLARPGEPLEKLTHLRGDPTLSAPRFSPNGRLITYAVFRTRDDWPTIWIMREDGSHRRMVAAGDTPAFMPGGNRLLFSGSRGICTMKLDGTDRDCVIDLPGRTAEHTPVSSQDRSKIAFIHRSKLLVMNRDGSNLHSPVKTAGIFEFDFSPDGRRLVYSRSGTRRGIFLVRPNGAGRHYLEPRRCPGNFLDSDPAFSPNGRRIVFLSGREQEGAGPPRCDDIGRRRSRLYTMRTDGTHRKKLRRHLAHSPAWGVDPGPRG